MSRSALRPMVRLALLAVLPAAVFIPAHNAQAELPNSPVCSVRTKPVKLGLTLVRTKRVDARTKLYSFRSKAVGAATPSGLVRVRVTVPTQYRTHPKKRFPVLYHLHGTNNSATTWSARDVEKILGKKPVIFVQPDGGAAGFYSDWYGTPVTGFDLFNGVVPNPPPAWESFHIRELVPWIDRHLRTTRKRSIAGSSMGGFGAMSYAARHPKLFKAAASFSGALNLDGLFPLTPLVTLLGYDPCIWGDPILQRANWNAHNPTTLARSLRGVSLFVAAGNGLPGKYDDAASAVSGLPLELLLRTHSDDFVAALRANNVPVTTFFYGNGTHPNPTNTRFYDFDDLRKFLPQAMAAMR